MKGFGEFSSNFRKVGARRRAQSGRESFPAKPQTSPWGEVGVAPAQPPLSSCLPGLSLHLPPPFLFLPRSVSLPPLLPALPLVVLPVPLLTWPELTLGSRTGSGGPRPGSCCCPVRERETKLKLIILVQLPSQLRDNDLHSLRPRLLPHPSLDLFLGGPPSQQGMASSSRLQGRLSVLASGLVQPAKCVCRKCRELPEDAVLRSSVIQSPVLRPGFQCLQLIWNLVLGEAF